MQDEIRFLAMPKYAYCLDHVIKESRSPLKIDQVVDILKCVMNALKYMHHNVRFFLLHYIYYHPIVSFRIMFMRILKLQTL